MLLAKEIKTDSLNGPGFCNPILLQITEGGNTVSMFGAYRVCISGNSFDQKWF